MLLLLEEKVPGFVREKMVVALYRLHGDGGFINFEDVSKLCRNTGYIPSSFHGSNEARRPKGHPESYFARFPINPELVRLIIGRLQTDDVYLMANSFPNPDHRSTRLAVQASYLFVILFFIPDILNNQKSTMREIVDKYFNDNWVIATYMGQIYDIAQEWASYPAAKQAIGHVITPDLVKQLSERNSSSINSCTNEVKQLLKEGILQHDYLLDNLNSLLNCVRNCNITLRWRLLHRRTKIEGVRKIIESSVNTQSIVALLLNVSELEFNLKEMLQQLIAQKNHAWTEGRASAADRMTELSEYFTGEKSLSRVKKDENMMRWFAGLAAQVESVISNYCLLAFYQKRTYFLGRELEFRGGSRHSYGSEDPRLDSSVRGCRTVRSDRCQRTDQDVLDGSARHFSYDDTYSECEDRSIEHTGKYLRPFLRLANIGRLHGGIAREDPKGSTVGSAAASNVPEGRLHIRSSSGENLPKRIAGCRERG